MQIDTFEINQSLLAIMDVCMHVRLPVNENCFLGLAGTAQRYFRMRTARI